ncbi:hypothetical protein A3J78_00960 [Candidatus Beckwithbacteria bacterium RBG_13_35_6]|uniref:THIF-type NAD/FAD binding fold domain-containing protein n=1 Tax=Candidatus Beckwithbacteria bacterium RBG_13_35_6 TaxID=1797456 RepID=A0A1F5DDU5_9BACT|nr:MAG: hypothetical protein A3J78_00960 [Candidatus Beckwithbacteria bacterium RBG_13_35_6]
MELSNVNRMLCADRWSVGEPKAFVLGAEILNLNPRVQVEMHVERFKPDKHANYLAEVDAVLEGIDGISVKTRLRDRLKAGELESVSMPTDTVFAPFVDVEGPFDPYFCRPDLDKKALDFLRQPISPREDPKGLIRQVALIMGEENIPPDLMAALYLFSQDLLSFWPQPALPAMLNAALLSYLHLESLAGRKPEHSRVRVSLPEIAGIKRYDSAQAKVINELFAQSLGL